MKSVTQPPGHTTRLQEALSLAVDDEQVRERIIEHTCDRLRIKASRMLGRFPKVRRWAETDDVLQNSLIRLHRALAEVKPTSARQFYGLAAMQIRRELIDLARKFDGAEGIGANHQTDDGELIRQSSSPPVEPDTLEAWGKFHNEVESLPAEQREVVELIWYNGISQPQAAEILGVSLATVKRRWQAARLKLFDLLKETDFQS